MDAPREADRLAELFGSDPRGLIALLSGQLGVLKQQAQILTGLSAIAITVTGFSGHHIVRAGLWSAGARTMGIACIRAGIVITLGTLGRLRWVTQDLDEDLSAMALAVIGRRNREQSALGWAGRFIALGLGSYLVAVCLAAFA